jgi:hypothetical protein
MAIAIAAAATGISQFRRQRVQIPVTTDAACFSSAADAAVNVVSIVAAIVWQRAHDEACVSTRAISAGRSVCSTHAASVSASGQASPG